MTQRWRVHPDWDTTGYRYSWKRNGQPATGVASATLATSLDLAGSNSVTAIATRADETSDTVTVAIGVAPSVVSLIEPATVYSGGTYTWTASSSGCNGSCRATRQAENGMSNGYTGSLC